MLEFETEVIGVPVTVHYYNDYVNGRGPDDDQLWPMIDKVMAHLEKGQKDIYNYLTTEQLSQLEWQIAKYEKRTRQEEQYA